MTATTMNPTALFQRFVQNHFKFPKEIKNDIVYCQRALKAHIKVHQMVLDVYKTQGNANPAEKQRITDELETQIYEINAEQQFLLLRLRRQISDFHKTLERKGMHVIPNFINETVSSELVPLINDQNFLVYPISVRLRSSEDQLIEKYFEVKQNDTPKNYFEILDSDEEEQEMEKEKRQKSNYKPIVEKLASKTSSKDRKSQQTSLLKPMAQRARSLDAVRQTSSALEFVEVSNNNSKKCSAMAPNMAVSTMKSKTESSNVSNVYPVGISASKSIIERERDDSLVSQNVKMSRLNLRQVLKNAQSGSHAAKLAASKAPNNQATLDEAERKHAIEVKKEEQNCSNLPNNRNVATTVTLSSSSDDSTPERCLAPPDTHSQFPLENVDTRIKAEDYGQEMFLRIFGLFTPEMHLQMQQRRSKRKRRTVQSNERSDFHYGRIEYANYNPPEEKKKRKVFLVSPQVKRKQGRPPKRRSVEKSDDATTSRSGTSSPDDKHDCIECHKVGGTLERCERCKYYYHQHCHSNSEKSNTSSKSKSCPPCRRLLRNESQQYKSLKTSADTLNQRLRVERTRRKNLQQKSQLFKTQMNALFNIIKAIKKDGESSLN